MKFATLIFAASTAMFAAAPAWAQIDSREGIALQNEISALHRDLDDLREQVGSGSGSGGSLLGGRHSSSSSSSSDAAGTNSDLMVGFLDRISKLEDQVRQLNGRVGELANAQQRDHDDLAKQISDLQFRLDTGGPGGKPIGGGPSLGASPAGGSQSMSPPPASLGTVPAKAVTPSVNTPAAPPQTPPAAAAPRNADQALREGNAALARRDYASAEQAAREVLANKSASNAYDAKFLLAQSLNGQKRSVDAAIAYYDAYQANKTGAHAQDALLGLANEQASLGNKDYACKALDSLNASFPQPRADIAAKASASRTANGCH